MIMTIEETLQLILDRLDELSMRIDKPDRTYSIRSACIELGCTRKRLLGVARRFAIDIPVARKNGCNPMLTYDQLQTLKKCLRVQAR